MATGITVSTTSNLESGQWIQIAAAREAFETASADPELISSESIPAGSKAWEILTYERLGTGSALTEGTDYGASSAAQQLVAATVTVTPSEHGVMVALSKVAQRRQPGSLEATTGRLMGISLRARQATDVTTLYDGFSKSIIGAGNAMDITHIRGAVAYLMTDNTASYGPAPMPYRASFHAEQISDIIVDLTDAGARVGGVEQGLSADLVTRWWRGNDRAYGVQIFNSGYLGISSNTAKGGLFAETALVMVMEGETEPTTEEDTSNRLVEYGLFQSWGESEIADSHGIEVASDVTATV